MGHPTGLSPEAPHKARLVLAEFSPITESKIHSQAEDPQGNPVLPLPMLGIWRQAFWGSPFPLWINVIQKQLLHSGTLPVTVPPLLLGFPFCPGPPG